MIKLTIAIPTYNRPDKLRYTLNRLLPFMTDECYLIIIDNHSDIPVATLTKDLFDQFNNINYTIYRNKINIGGDSNIMRCFEYAETEWLWTVGDDDEIVEGAIETILNDIKQHSNALLINYNSPSLERVKRTKPIFANNLGEFLTAIDTFGAVMYITCNVQNNFKLKQILHLCNHNTYSCASQTLAIIYSLMANDELTILSNKIVCYNPVQAESGSNISLAIARGLSTLLDIPMSTSNKKILLNKIRTNNSYTLEGVLRSLLISYYRPGQNSKIDVKFLFNRFYHILFRHYTLPTKTKFFIYQLALLCSPKTFFKLIQYYYENYKKGSIN
jgi:glycosyltransferase involved in cell wall biosynthesis